MYQHIPSVDTKVHFDQRSNAVGLGRSPAGPQGGQDNPKGRATLTTTDTAPRRRDKQKAEATGREGQTGRLAECAKEGDARCTAAGSGVMGPREADPEGKPKTTSARAQHGGGRCPTQGRSLCCHTVR